MWWSKKEPMKEIWLVPEGPVSHQHEWKLASASEVKAWSFYDGVRGMIAGNGTHLLYRCECRELKVKTIPGVWSWEELVPYENWEKDESNWRG